MEYMPSKVRSYYFYARVVDESVIERHFAWHGLNITSKQGEYHSGRGLEPTTNPAHIRHRLRNPNPGDIEGRQVRHDSERTQNRMRGYFSSELSLVYTPY